MKRIYMTFFLFAAGLLLFSGCTAKNPAETQDTINGGNFWDLEYTQSETYENEDDGDGEELIGVWCSYNELSMKEEGGGTAEQFREKVSRMFSAAREIGINAVFVQVRPFCDAFYKSELFPWSEYLTGEQGKDPGYDPLEIMTGEARKLGLQIHCWINPYRVSYKNDISLLSEDNPARKMYEEDADSVYISEGGIFLNPAKEEAKRLVTDGAAELLEYDIDGIHMDDYFYPDTGEKIDGEEYKEYAAAGGGLSLAQWRRNQVSSLVGGIYAKIKSISPDVVFGISPTGDLEKNYNSLYADIELWCSKSGYVDYIMPQLYYGFENETMPFEKTAKEWAELVPQGSSVKLYGGLALYKCGLEDEYAGAQSEKKDTGRYEWINNDDIISRQISCLRECGYDGISLYSFKSLMNASGDEHLKSETEKIMGILQ